MIRRNGPVLEITAGDWATIQADLNEAVQILQSEAAINRHGVLVTQLGFASYTAAISAEVPFGVTLETRNWVSGRPQPTGT